jgi:FixJ family two-component response regulator
VADPLAMTSSARKVLANGDRPIVFVIEDDQSVRIAIDSLMRSVGLEVQSFGSTREFIDADRPDTPGCIVLDIRLPGQSGLDFQDELVASGIPLPIIFITGHGDIPMSVRALKAGALEFLTKPFRDQDLIDAVILGIERNRKQRKEAQIDARLERSFTSLTPREREIMARIAAGRPNKQVAAELGLSEVTVKVHRGNVMRKMQAKSLADLVRMVDRLRHTEKS